MGEIEGGEIGRNLSDHFWREKNRIMKKKYSMLSLKNLNKRILKYFLMKTKFLTISMICFFYFDSQKKIKSSFEMLKG